jgi:acyl dehydratase
VTTSERYSYTVTSEFPGLDESSLDEARSLIGVPLRRDHFRWNDTVAADSVRQFARGISDENPLYVDPEYAAKARFGRITAPPTYLYSIDRGHVAPRLRAVQWIYAGTDWEWYEPLCDGMRVTSEAQLVAANWVEGKMATRMILQEGEVLYHAEDGRLLAKARTKIFRIPRAKAKGGLSYRTRDPHNYTPAEMEAIEDAIDAEEIRGAQTRYWDDVHAGDKLQPLVKGPFNMSDMVMFYCGSGCFYLAHEMAFKHRRKHPADAYSDPKTGAKDHPARGHTEEYMAAEVGMPGRYDSGLQRVCWLGQVATNWMGDDGDLLALNTRLRRPNVFGDTQWCSGTVTGKRTVGDDHLLDIELRAVNQVGTTTTEGTAVVRLPARSA